MATPAIVLCAATTEGRHMINAMAARMRPTVLALIDSSFQDAV